MFVKKIRGNPRHVVEKTRLVSDPSLYFVKKLEIRNTRTYMATVFNALNNGRFGKSARWILTRKPFLQNTVNQISMHWIELLICNSRCPSCQGKMDGQECVVCFSSGVLLLEFCFSHTNSRQKNLPLAVTYWCIYILADVIPVFLTIGKIAVWY